MAFQIPEDKNAPPPTSNEQIELWALEKEKLVQLPAGDEIDSLIAQKVYGLVRYGRTAEQTLFHDSVRPDYLHSPRKYSRNVDFAIHAAETCRLFDDLNVLLGKDSDGNWSVIYEGQDYTTLIASAKELPLALCRAILVVIFDREHPVIKPASTWISPIAGNAF